MCSFIFFVLVWGLELVLAFFFVMDPSVLYSSNHRRRGYPKPARERHPVSATMSFAGVICLLVALAEPRWSKRGTSACTPSSSKVCVDTLGLFSNNFNISTFESFSFSSLYFLDSVWPSFLNFKMVLEARASVCFCHSPLVWLAVAMRDS